MTPATLRAAQIAYDNQSPDESDDAHREWVGDRTDELVRERMADPVNVAAALDEMAGTSDLNSDGNSFFAAALAEHFTHISFGQRDAIREQLETHIRRDAETQAEAEWQKAADEAESTRGHYTGEAA